MMFDEDLLRKIVVRIDGKKSRGSGFIVPSAEPKRFYCITAKHCLDDENIRLTQLTDNHEEIILKYTDILKDTNKDHDLAIISLKNNPSQPYPQKCFVGYANKEYNEGGLAGYPQSRNGFVVFKVEIKSKDASNNTLTMQLTNANTSLEFLKEQIEGISGGCVFVVEDNDEYKLLATETELADKNASFNEITGITLAMVNDLLKSNGWPPLAPPKYRYASISWGEGKNVLIKEKECHNSEWVKTEVSDNLIETIQDHLLEGGHQPLLLCGYSGIGKTRTVLQACVQCPMLFNALFFNCYEQFISIFNTKLRKYFDSSTDESIYLIVDDVSLDEWSRLTEILKNYSNVHTVSIAEMGQADIDPTYKMLVQMRPYDETDVIKIVRNHCPSLSDEELKDIFRLSDNDIRFAFLIADSYSQLEKKELWSLSAQRSGKQILKKIMTQVVEEKYIDILKIFSLFVDFGYIRNSKQEIDFIKDYFKYSEIILNNAIDFCVSHRLGIKRGNYFELSPRALARLLFAEYHMCIIKDYEDFMDRLPTDELRRRFIMRAYECGSETWRGVHDTLVSWFRQKYGNASLVVSNGYFGNKYVELSVGNIAEAMTFVEFIPDEGLQWMQRLIKCTDGDVLDSFSGYKGRRQFVWTCERLACFKEHFETCEKILFELSQHETESSISNNSSGIWSGLFGVLVSNTETPLEERLNILITRMCYYGNEQNYDLFNSALSNALSMSGSRLLPPKMIGGRMTPINWAEHNIRTVGDLFDAHTCVLTKLEQNESNLPISMRQVVFQTLKDHIAEYTSNLSMVSSTALYTRYRKILEQFAYTAEQRLEVVIAINTQLECEELSCKNESDNSAPDQRIRELIQWRDSIAQTDLISRIKVCLAGTFLHTDECIEKIKKLAVELIESANASNVLTTILSLDNIQNYSFSRFAQALGEADTSYKLKAEINENFAHGSNSFSENYYFGIYDRTKEMPNFLKQILCHTIDKNPDGVFKVSIVCDFSNDGTQRIIDLVEKGVINNYVLSLGEQWQIRHLSLEQMECILSALVKGSSRDGAFFFFLIGKMWLEASPSVELENIIYRHTVELPLKERQRNSSNFVKLIMLMSHHLLDCLILVIRSIDYSCSFNTQAELVLFVKNYSHGQYAKEIAFNVCDCLEAQFEQIPCATSFSWLIDLLDSDIVLNWINCKPAYRAKIIAYHLPAPSFKEQYVPELTLKVLERYGDDEKVFRRFLSGIHAFETYNLDNVKENSTETFTVLEDYKKHSHALIRKWAEYETDRIKALVEEKEQLDLIDDRFGDN